MTTEIATVEELKDQVAPVVREAADIVVSSPEGYENAANFLKLVKTAQKKVTGFFAPLKSKAYAAWKEITAKEGDMLRPLKDAEDLLKDKILEYRAEQARIRRAEQARLQAEADERARKERERLEKEAAKLKTPEKREARLEEAAAIVAPVVEVAAKVPEVEGQSIRKAWKARVTDAQAAATAILAWPDWSAYLTLNTAELNRFAARTKGAVQVPGVEFYEDTTLASKGA